MVREKFKSALMEEFKGCGLQFSTSGQIGIDIFPIGWDKTFCLQYIEKDGFDTIHFFGDSTAKVCTFKVKIIGSLIASNVYFVGIDPNLLIAYVSNGGSYKLKCIIAV